MVTIFGFAVVVSDGGSILLLRGGSTSGSEESNARNNAVHGHHPALETVTAANTKAKAHVTIGFQPGPGSGGDTFGGSTLY